jgi:pimeloyl-ACP methyl ester carboxylesterase
VRGSHLWIETRGSGPPLVFLHGGILYFDNNFVRQRDDFAASRQVIGIDRRGHGHSPDDARPFSYQDMADDMAAAIEQLALGPVDVIGHSDGGNVGLILARRHPKLVRRLVVSGANLRPGLTPEQLEERRNRSPEQQDAAIRKFSDRLPAYFRTDYEKTSPDGPERWWTFLAKSNQMWLAPVVIPTADLKTIDTPVLVMAGDHDFMTIEETLEIYGNLAHGQLFILPATGHGTMWERPELVNLAMHEFLDRPDAPVKP